MLKPWNDCKSSLDPRAGAAGRPSAARGDGLDRALAWFFWNFTVSQLFQRLAAARCRPQGEWLRERGTNPTMRH